MSDGSYNFGSVMRQKPATLLAIVEAFLAFGQGTWELVGNSPIPDALVMSLMAFIGLLLSAAWVDAVTVHVGQAKDDADKAFLAGLSLPQTKLTEKSLEHLADTKAEGQTEKTPV